MQNTISLDDVIASESKYGYVLEPDLKNIRDLKKMNPKSKYDTTYIPILFKHVNGKLMKTKIKFIEQMIASGAKVPQGSDDEGVAKYLNISFKKLSQDEIEGGDYAPKKKDSDEKQEKENKRIADNILRYISYNEKFIKVLDIIDTSYKKVCNDLKANEKSLDFRLKKDRKQTDITVYSMKQTSRVDKETNEETIMETPIYRLKISVCKKEEYKGKIGIWSNWHNEFKPIVFDARKMTKRNNYQPVPAKVKVDGKLRDLDINNASSFIVYKSLIGGTILFESIVASKFGLSLSNNFSELYVFRHKTKIEQKIIAKEDIISMRGGDEEDEDDSEVEIEDPRGGSDNEEDEDNEEDDDLENTEEPHDSDEENPN